MDSVSVFVSYSHKDEELRDALDVHMAPLRRGKLISAWHDRKIGLGTEWDAAIDAQMQSADITVLLLSPDFINSDYCHDTEIPTALARHASGEALVIPVILRPFEWYESPVAHLQSIPRDKRAVTLWDNRDQAFQNVVGGIREEAIRLLDQRRQQALQREATRDRYLTKVLEAFSDGRISTPERETLDELRDKLGLSAEEARAIEIKAEEPIRQYNENLERYKNTLRKVLLEEYPISAQTREDLKLRRRDLGLKDEDADRVEVPILAEFEAGLQDRLAAPPPPPPPAPAPAPARSAPAPAPAPVAASASPPPRADVGDVVMAVLDQLLEKNHKFRHLAPNIPAKQLANARKCCQVPADDEVLGVIDLTVFGSSSRAMVFGRKALYHCHYSTPFRMGWMDWASQGGADFVRKNSEQIVAPDGQLLTIFGYQTDELVTLLNQIRASLRAKALGPAHHPASGSGTSPGGGAPAHLDAAAVQMFDQLQAGLSRDIDRILNHRGAGAELSMEALTQGIRAEVLRVVVEETGHLLVAFRNNNGLPPTLHIQENAQAWLIKDLQFTAFSDEHWAFYRRFGKRGEVEPNEVAHALREIWEEIFYWVDDMAVDWNLVLP